MREIIKITANAFNKLKVISKDQNYRKLVLSVKTGGCNGLSYELTPMDSTDKDQTIEINEVLSLCKKSEMYVIGTTIDLQKTLMGETFRFQNPQATSKCGCGESFHM